MKAKRTSFCMLTLFLATIVAGPSLSRAEKMSLEAHDLVIQKLEESLNQIEDEKNVMDPIGIHLQLGNLYSEKARLLFVEEGKKNCQNCLKSDSFREKALKQYGTIREKLKGAEFESVSFQMGHLLELNKKEKESQKIYQELIRSRRTSNEALIRAYSKRGSYYFSIGEFNKALADFNVVFSKSRPEERGPVLHRIAWSQLNRGQTAIAIKIMWDILGNEIYLKTKDGQTYEYSSSFHVEVVHDLALFLAKAPLTDTIIHRFMEACPDDDVVDSLLLLGDEAERTGQTKGAITAWQLALENKDFPKERRPNIYLKIAQLYRGEFQFKSANKLFSQSLESTKDIYGDIQSEKSCTTECQSQIAALRNFVLNWDRENRKWTKGSMSLESRMGLIEAYSIYHRYNNRDFQTYLGLAQLSNQMNQKAIALNAFSRAADLLSAYGKPQDKNLLEPTLLSEISLAEQSTSKELQLKSYDHYLKLNENGAKQNSVRYQRAKVLYDLNRYADAFRSFDECVTDPNFKDAELKLKAAHLSLDTLVLAKDLETLESRGLYYAQVFPKERVVFQKIARKAGIEIVKAIALKEVSVESAKKALRKMNTISLDQNDQNEYKTLMRMKIDLSLKAQSWSQARSTLDEYQHLRSLTANEKVWTLKQRLKLAQLFLDFHQAVQIVKELGFLNSNNPSDLFTGALLTELSGADPSPWLERVIHNRKTTLSDSLIARAQLVRTSRNQWQALKFHLQPLLTKPELVADLTLEAYTVAPRGSEATSILTNRKVSHTWSAQFLQRLMVLDTLKAMGTQLQNQRINTRSNALLASSIQNRIAGINRLQTFFKSAQRMKDWTLQVYTAHWLAVANDHLSQEIENLPVPRTIAAKDRMAYSQELIRQASPFRSANQDYKSFLASSWRNTRYLNDLLLKAQLGLKILPLFKKELQTLSSIAPEGVANDISNVVEKLDQKWAERKQIPELQKELREDPLNKNIIDELIRIEKQSGHDAMVAFLNDRQKTFKGGY